jgi:hypothetical protein
MTIVLDERLDRMPPRRDHPRMQLRTKASPMTGESS